MAAFRQALRTGRTNAGTQAAAYAFAGIISKLLFARKSLRVMAPRTAKRTALEENCCADPVAVVDGKAFDIKYCRCHDTNLTVCFPSA